MSNNIIGFLPFILLLFASCGQIRNVSMFEAEEHLNGSIEGIGTIEKGVLSITRSIDLHGKTYNIPVGIIFRIEKGCTVKNGVLKGNNTQLHCADGAFDHITIQGTWSIPFISSSFFYDLSQENSLKDVFALANPFILNRILIEEGDYWVSASTPREDCLRVCSNSTVEINGNIRLIPNDLTSCNIIKIEGDSISVLGKGSIIGDKDTHKGKDGEWGMGINIRASENVSITGLTIRDLWGDCVYIGGGSKRVRIENCLLDHGRRQGISITNAEDVEIRDCRISNVFGTNPQYAIDVEPNNKGTVDRVVIENVEVDNCKGGIQITEGRKGEGKRVGAVTVRGCTLNVVAKNPIRIRKAEAVTVERCLINTEDIIPTISSVNVGRLIIRNNTVNILQRNKSNAKMDLFYIDQSEFEEVRNNRINIKGGNSSF